MHQNKIENFSRDNPGRKFPQYFSLDTKNMELHRQIIIHNFGLNPDITDLDLVKQLEKISVKIEGINANDEQFNLYNTLLSIKIKPKDQVYINWYRFDEIDQMKIADLSNYFDDIWYPGPDDIDIYDDSFQWILSVPHYGVLSMLAR